MPMAHHHKHHYYIPGIVEHLDQHGFHHPFPGVTDSAQAAPQLHGCHKGKVCVTPARRKQRLF
jgi:hypothetical protein